MFRLQTREDWLKFTALKVTGEYNGAEMLSQITHSTHCIQQTVLWRSSTGSSSDSPCQEGQFVKQKALSLSQKRNTDGIRRNSQIGGFQNKINLCINLPFSKTFTIKATDKSCNSILPFSYLFYKRLMQRKAHCKSTVPENLQWNENLKYLSWNMTGLFISTLKQPIVKDRHLNMAIQHSCLSPVTDRKSRQTV